MLHSTQAILLNTYRYGDSSLICNLFSKHSGKLSLMAKGARTIKNPNKAILQPSHYIEIEYYYKPKRDLQILKEASIKNHFNNIKKSYNKLSYTFICLDILNKISQIDNPCDIMFRLITRTLDKINTEQENHNIIYFIFFQFQLLRYLGYQPNLNNCTTCDGSLIKGIYDFQIGHIVCPKCIMHSNNITLDKDTFQLILQFENSHINDICKQINPEDNNLKIINQFLINYISYHVLNILNMKSLKLIN